MIERTILKQIKKAVSAKPVTLIVGARQVGKSTLAMTFEADGFSYISLRNIRNRELAKTDPALFLSLHPWPLIIDEVQYAPGLLEEIETIVDEEKRKNEKNYGMYILTGSSMYNLLKKASDSLAGRMAVIHMLPLSNNELICREEIPFSFNINELDKRAKSYSTNLRTTFESIVKGFYPEIYSNSNLDREMFYSSYVETYIEKDINDVLKIKDKNKFKRLMEVLASLTGEELNYANIAKIIGINENTVKEWISVLEAGDIVYTLQPYNDVSVVKRIVRRPKLYFNDTGLAAYLARLDSSETLMVSAFSGRFIETYIINEIRKSYINNGINPLFYYYRDSNMNEIDLLIIEQGKLHRIECKQGISYSFNDVKGFKQVENSSLEIGTSFIICSTDVTYQIKDDIYVIPLSSI